MVIFFTVFAARARRWGTARTEPGGSHSSWKGSLLLSTPATAACLMCRPDIVCPSRLGGMMQPAKAAHGAFFSLAGSSLPPGLRARRALFPTCGVVHVAGYSVVWNCDPTPRIFLKSTKRSAAAIIRSQRSFITFHGALWNILLSAGFPAMFHMITLEQTFVNSPLQKNFSCCCF